MSQIDTKKLTYENGVRIKCSDTESSKVPALVGESTFSMVLPKKFAIALGIGKGDFVVVTIDKQKMLVEKSD